VPGKLPVVLRPLLQKRVAAGDTLFLQGCGRVDLPGGDAEEMRRRLTQRPATIPDHVVLYPGHAYGGEHAPMSVVRTINRYLSSA